MPKRYALSDLLKELEQDGVKSGPQVGGKLSQADIRERIAARRAKTVASVPSPAPNPGTDTYGESRE